MSDFFSRVVQMAEETAASPDSLWWMSFADADLPTGSQFLGACLVQGNSMPAAITRSHLLGLNPGGQVWIAGPIPPDNAPPGYPVEQLLTRLQIDTLDKELLT